MRALEAGKHVLCEKPLSRHPEEVERAFDAAERNDRVLAEAFMWRHHPQAQRLRELAGELGEVRLVRGAFSFPLADRRRTCAGSADARRRRPDGRGLLLRLGRALPARRARRRSPPRAAGERRGRALGRARCASRAARSRTSTAASTSPSATSSRWWASEGSLFLDDPWHSRRPVIERARAPTGRPRRSRSRRRTPTAASSRTSRARARARPSTPSGAPTRVGQARAIAALYEAADSGRAVAL